MSEKLNEWAVFNEKNKELCEWLTQMESKVSQNGDVSIEEMMEKLRKVSTVYQGAQVSDKQTNKQTDLPDIFGHFTHTHAEHGKHLASFSQEYQEEINVAEENKQQLQTMGQRLAKASQESKAAEIQQKLNKVSERWQHLLDLIAAR